MNNIDLILDIVKDIRSTIHDFQKQQNEINSRVTKVEATIKSQSLSSSFFWIFSSKSAKAFL